MGQVQHAIVPWVCPRYKEEGSWPLLQVKPKVLAALKGLKVSDDPVGPKHCFSHSNHVLSLPGMIFGKWGPHLDNLVRVTLLLHFLELLLHLGNQKVTGLV